MIKRSFKPAKCKTALKMASSRIKLLKNKKEVQVRQLKRELAQLLAAGQDPTARIRVEHVVREEKMMDAYELIQIYSELILVRMPMIESQKNCPIDLKEAVASVIFAAPRCADVPELMDARKHFTAKYGKDFVTAAVELHPNCGVSRLMVEKLASKAPDGPTKIKILTAIAEEHNVKWEPKSFGESDAKHAEDLLKGATTFQQATAILVQRQNAAEPPNSVVKGPINDRVSTYDKNDPSTNSYIPDSRSSCYSQTPTGVGAGKSEFQHSHTEGGSNFSSGRQSWNMEFKDATAAAQAAAESAERASMAARAAAEFSSQERMSRQHTTESPTVSASPSRDEGPQYHTGSRLHGEHVTQHPTSNTSFKRNSETHPEQLSGDEQDDLAGLTQRFNNLRNSNNSGLSVSPNPKSASVVDHPEVKNIRMADSHSQKGLPLEKRNSLHEAGLKKKPIGSDVAVASDVDGGMKFESDDYSEGASARKQSINVSSRSHSQTSRGDYNARSYKTVQAVNDLRMADGHFQNVSPELEKRSNLREASLRKKSIRSEMDVTSKVEDGMRFETDDYLESANVREQSSNAVSRSHSQTSNGDYNAFSNRKVQKVNDHRMADSHSQKGSLELEKKNSLHEASLKNKSIGSEIDMASEVEFGMEFETSDHLQGASVRKQSSNVPSRSHSQSSSGDYDVFSSKKIEEPYEEAFVADGKTTRNDLETSCDNSVVFDGSGSDGDGIDFDFVDEDDKEASNSYFSSGGKKSSYMVADAHTWSPRQKTDVSFGKSSSQLHFSPEKQPGRVIPQQNDLSPMTFDDSEGPTSDSEVEQDKSSVIQRTRTDVSPRKVSDPRNREPIRSENPHLIRSQFVEEQSLGSNGSTWLKPSSPDSDAAVVRFERKQESGATPKTGRRFGHSDLYTSQTSFRTGTSESNSNDRKYNFQGTELSAVEDDVQRHQLPVSGKDAEEPNLDTGKALNFGTLTGGLKNKGYRFPPYRQSIPGKLSMSKQDEENTSSRIDKSSSSHLLGINSGADDWDMSNEIVPPKSNRKTTSQTPSTYFDPDDSDEEHPQQNYSISAELYTRKPIELNKGSSLDTYFGSNGDSEDEISKKTSTVQASPGARISRRTKASPASQKDSYSKAKVVSESSTSADYASERKASSNSSYVAETRSKPRSLTNSSDYQGISDQHKPVVQPSLLMPQSKKVVNEESSSRRSYATDIQQKQSHLRSSDSQAKSEQARSEQAAPKYSPEPKRSLLESPKSSPREQPPARRPPMTAAFGTAESSKVSSARGVAPSRENSEQAILEQAAPKRSPEPKRSLRESVRSSPREQPPARRPPVTAALGTAESSKVASVRGEVPSRENSEQERAAPKPTPEPKRSLREIPRSSPREQPPASPPPVAAASGTAESSKVSSAGDDVLSRENSISKASHVHPKLPDFDSLAARIRSLSEDLK